MGVDLTQINQGKMQFCYKVEVDSNIIDILVPEKNL